MALVAIQSNEQSLEIVSICALLCMDQADRPIDTSGPNNEQSVYCIQAVYGLRSAIGKQVMK